jgi:glucokinase
MTAGTESGVVVAVDMGGTTTKGALVAADGRVVGELVRPTPVDDGPAAVLDRLEAVVVSLARDAGGGGDDGRGGAGARAGPGRGPVRAVGVVVPGVVDVPAGRVVFAGNLGLRDVGVRDRLAAATGLPTLLEHDVRAAGVAERTVGAARGVDDHVVAVIGTGVAAVVHVGGTPVRGARGVAGELGHIPVWPDGEPCPCGQRGCLERYASASAIVRRYLALGGADGATAVDVAARRDTDSAAAQAWDEATQALAIGLATCAMLLDPEAIVLAGGLSQAGAALLDPVRSQLATRLAWREPPDVRLSPLGARAGVIGAALLAWQRVRAAGSAAGDDPVVAGDLAAWTTCAGAEGRRA